MGQQDFDLRYQWKVLEIVWRSLEAEEGQLLDTFLKLTQIHGRQISRDNVSGPIILTVNINKFNNDRNLFLFDQLRANIMVFEHHYYFRQE